MSLVPACTLTRIAPTPSGFLHLGNVLSFALTEWMAEQTGAAVLLRIDDLDRDRLEKKYVDDIFETLNFLQLPWQQGPAQYADYSDHWSQVHRMDIYQQALERLREKGFLFACTCSRTDIVRNAPDGVYPGTCRYKNIPLDTAGACWRLKTAPARQVIIRNWDGIMIEAALPERMHDFIVRKKDGYPSYQLSSVMDDDHFGTDLLVRGADLWESTLAQCCLADILEIKSFQRAIFFHHGLLESAPGQKLSKSAGATSVRHLRQAGKTARNIYQMIAALLGNNLAANSWQQLAAVYMADKGKGLFSAAFVLLQLAQWN